MKTQVMLSSLIEGCRHFQDEATENRSSIVEDISRQIKIYKEQKPVLSADGPDCKAKLERLADKLVQGLRRPAVNVREETVDSLVSACFQELWPYVRAARSDRKNAIDCLEEAHPWWLTVQPLQIISQELVADQQHTGPKFAIFASGQGSNAEVLMKAFKSGFLAPAQLVMVL